MRMCITPSDVCVPTYPGRQAAKAAARETEKYQAMIVQLQRQVSEQQARQAELEAAVRPLVATCEAQVSQLEQEQPRGILPARA